MHVDEVLKLAKKGKLDQIESAWTELIGEEPAELEPLFGIPEVLIERGHTDLAESLVWYLIDLLSERGQAARALRAAQTAGRLLPDSELLRGLLADLYVQIHADRADIDGLVQLTIRSPDLPLDEAMAGLANLMSVSPGSYVLDPQHGTVGRVEGLDSDKGGLVVTFDGSEKAYGAALVARLKLTDEEDFRALAAFERERLEGLARDDPEELVRILLSTIDRRMELRRLRLYLEPVVGSWGKWWSAARGALKRSSLIGMTEGGAPSLFLRKKPLSLAERLLRRFDAAGSALAKLSMALHLLHESQAHGGVSAEARQHVVDEVARSAVGAPAPLAAAAAAVAEALCSQWEGVSAPEATTGAVAELLADPEAVAAALEPGDVLLCTLEFVRRRAPAGWLQLSASLMPVVGREACAAIAQRLAAGGAQAELEEARREILARSDRSPGALAWLWREWAAGQRPERPGSVGPAGVVIQLLSTLAALVRRADLTEEVRKAHIAELRVALFVRNGAPLKEVLQGARPEQVAAVKDLGERNPALTERMQADLMRMAREVRPALFARALPPWQEGAVYTTEAGIARRREELEQIVHVRLPEVIREIGQAAGFGDVSDNAEYRSAVAERARLAERAARIQEELSEARLIKPEMARTDHVTVGSRVVVRNLASGETETLTFLGPWEAAPEERVYAYNAPLGLAFMGKRAGDTVSFQAGTEERRWEVLETGPAL